MYLVSRMQLSVLERGLQVRRQAKVRLVSQVRRVQLGVGPFATVAAGVLLMTCILALKPTMLHRSRNGSLTLIALHRVQGLYPEGTPHTHRCSNRPS